MKTTKILTAVSAAALLGISSFALAQGTGRDTAPGSSGGSTMQRQEAPAGGSSGERMSPSQTQKEQGRDGQKAVQGKEMDKDTKKSQAQGKEMGKETQKSTQTQGMDSQKSTTQSQSGQMGKDTQKSQAQDKSMSKDAPKAAQSPTDSKSQMSQDKDAAKSGSTVGAAPSGAVNLTTEQRTTIRQEVLTERAPRVTNINFSVNVGTVVPSSVRVIEVPPTIVRIQPRWKGYRYFVYNDEIIIVEPRTLKIVAVLDV
jgi:Protein of unknown function (DUF1236)